MCMGLNTHIKRRVEVTPEVELFQYHRLTLPKGVPLRAKTALAQFRRVNAF